MQMGPKWEDSAWRGLRLVFFGQVITESQMATFKLKLQMSCNMERNVFQRRKQTANILLYFLIQEYSIVPVNVIHCNLG